MQNQMEIQEEFQMPPIDFELEFAPLENQSMVMMQSKVFFPKVDLIIDKNGVKQLSNPNNNLTKFKIIPSNMIEKQVLGKGAAGVVRRAIYTIDNVQMVVAVKEIVATVRQKRNQLLNDLRTFLTGQMSEYLVQFYGCYYHAGLVKQVIQYMNMGSLRGIVSLVAQGKLFIEEENLVQIIKSILNGLYHIHKIKHQIHRDIKPQNILVNDSGQIKIADFGVTKYIENTVGAANTFVDIGVYMSPQRITFSSKYDYKCDVWGLGLILYELATGNQIPYKVSSSESIFNLMNRIMSQNPPNLDATNRSSNLKSFINACLQRNPQARSSVEQLLNHPWITNKKENASMVDFMSKVKQLMQKQ